MNNIIQLKIVLQGSIPQIWRLLLVDGATTFEKLHHVIQLAMGWKNSHLYEFDINGYTIAEPNEELDDEFGNKFIDASTVTLESMLVEQNENFSYIYDFGDDWVHQIIAEKPSALDDETKYPVCIDGKSNCPPENCGGIPGFCNLIDIISNKRHPERKDMLEWLGGNYDANHFDKNEVNRKLASMDNYIKALKRYRDNE